MTKDVAPQTTEASNSAKSICKREGVEPMHTAQTVPFDKIPTAAAVAIVLSL